MIRSALSLVLFATLAVASVSAAPAQTTSRSRSSSKPASTAIVNLNTATAAELEGLPGIGAKTAARIVEYRQKNGNFKKIEELMNVQGVGEKNFLKIKAQISVGGVKTADDHTQR